MARREQELAETRADIMLSQIQPHFLYNTLTAIREMCLSDPTEAARMVTDFSAYLRENMACSPAASPSRSNASCGMRARTWRSRQKNGSRSAARGVRRAGHGVLAAASVAAGARGERGASRRDEARGGRRVRVASTEEPDAFVVTVVDDGVGFEPDAVGLDGRLHVGIANVSARVEALVRRRACGGSTLGAGSARRCASRRGRARAAVPAAEGAAI